MDFERYRPRRSAKRWLEDAPEYVVACYDNGGKSADRYTVLFGGSLWDKSIAEYNYRCNRPMGLINALAMSEHPSSAQGVSIWCECKRGPHLGKKVRWLDLPENVREYTIARATTD